MKYRTRQIEVDVKEFSGKNEPKFLVEYKDGMRRYLTRSQFVYEFEPIPEPSDQRKEA